jgi:serine phosphatase RsbU (regulator of sigma subunit)
MDNPSCMFVTLAHGLYDPATGDIDLAIAGHPPPLLRRADGRIEEVEIPSGRLLGYPAGPLDLRDGRLSLAPGDMLVFVTDGILEARSPVDRSLFGSDRLKELVAGFTPKRTLAQCATQAKTAIELFTGSKDLQDDVTLLLLRRPG